MKASVILDRAARIMHDETNVRWAAATLLEYLNAGRRAMITDKPAEFKALRVVTLVEGYEQTVPTDTAWFFGLMRNMGVDGLTIGNHIRQVDFKALEAFLPSWAKKSNRTVKEWAQDDPKETTYLVNPPIPASPVVQVECSLAAYPVDLTADTDDVGYNDRYERPLLYYVLHLCWAQDSEVGDAKKAGAMLSAYHAALGVG